MAKKLVAFYSRADENYFGGSYRYITVGNTEKAAKMIAKATGAELFFCTHEGSGLSGTERDIAKTAKNAKVAKGIAICGSHVDSAEKTIEGWV